MNSGKTTTAAATTTTTAAATVSLSRSLSSSSGTIYSNPHRCSPFYRLSQEQQQQQQQQQQGFQTRFISKYISKSAKKRIPLTTKRAGKGYYKGKGATKEGRLTTKGRFIPDEKKKLELMVPDLKGFTLKPYIARKASKIPPELRKKPGQM
eukprot:CAMPEP_0197175132 /NCGR_PEP_ID=MMETSP1423-20130617/1431_1 /TAXON_ID=476441 /ORGANISM="Pseudo-nitzschia heimii, Strain UNC1101" /LENGTH=150 /DNA_ID=CAMNT_0042624207 /DNA_START=127 /DNA_END=579 /DNA_ORIENTATION=-